MYSNRLKTSLILILFLTFSNFILGQIYVPREIKDSLYIDESYEGNINLDENLLRIVLNNEFSRLITGNTLTGLGNYASINTANNSLDANINIIRDSKIYGFKLQASINDDIANIFSNNKLNNNFGFGFTYHRLFASNNIAINTNDYEEINNKTKKIVDSYKKEKLTIENATQITQESIDKKVKEKSLLENKLTKLKNLSLEIKMVNDSIAKLKSLSLIFEKRKTILKGKIKNIENNETRNAYILSKNNIKLTFLLEEFNELKFLISSNNNTIKTLQKEKIKLDGFEKNKVKLLAIYNSKVKILEHDIKNLEKKKNNYKYDNKELIYTARNKAIQDIRENLKKVDGIKATDIYLDWMSIGVELKYQTFNLFDSTRNFDEQVVSTNDLVPSFFFSLSSYTNRPLFGTSKKAKNKEEGSFFKNNETKHIKYYSLGFKGTYGNNLQNLTQTEVETRQTISNARDLVKRQNVYLGDFEEEDLSGQFFLDYYQFMGSKNNVGLHLKTTLDVGSFRPVYSLRTGVLLPFTDSSNTKSIVNLEVFFGLNDIFNKANEQSLFSRNVFGVQISLPLNFKLL